MRFFISIIVYLYPNIGTLFRYRFFFINLVTITGWVYFFLYISKKINKLFLTRGVPGTHDVKMLLQCLNNLKKSNFKKMIIIGKKDPVLEFQKLTEEAENTNSKLIVFPDGHMSHIENTEALISVLKDFTKSC